MEAKNQIETKHDVELYSRKIDYGSLKLFF